MRNFMYLSLTALAVILLPQDVFAGSTTGLPWEGPLQTLSKSMTGPVATTIAIIALVAAGTMLIWGGEISGFIKTMVYIVLVTAVMILGNKMISTLFGSGGAVISQPSHIEQTLKTNA